MKTLLLVSIVCVLCFVSCSQVPENKTQELHRHYMEALINHDLEALRQLTSSDFVWQLGPYTLSGVEEALAPNEYDAAMEAELSYNNVEIAGDTVEFDLWESSDMIRAVGLDSLLHHIRIIFAEDLVVRREFSRPSAELNDFGRRMMPLQIWIQQNHPETLPSLVNNRGFFIFSKESGVLMRKLAEEWLQAGAPGRTTEQPQPGDTTKSP